MQLLILALTIVLLTVIANNETAVATGEKSNRLTKMLKKQQEEMRIMVDEEVPGNDFSIHGVIIDMSGL